MHSLQPKKLLLGEGRIERAKACFSDLCSDDELRHTIGPPRNDIHRTTQCVSSEKCSLRPPQDLGLLDIATRLHDLVTRARSGKLAPAEYQGGFTLSNLGMFGITAVWPILNPPHACILGIGAVERVPVVDGDSVVPGAVMRCSLSADHRAVDGAVGAQWLARFRRYVEDPREMIL